jgi:CheY-like chemotaxis protein
VSAIASGGRILVVDDSAVNRMVLTTALAAQGHTALTAEHGLQALELLRADGELPVDVVLLDLEMPELDGEIVGGADFDAAHDAFDLVDPRDDDHR